MYVCFIDETRLEFLLEMLGWSDWVFIKYCY